MDGNKRVHTDNEHQLIQSLDFNEHILIIIK